MYLVVLFHAGSDRFSGGYIGVDVFFVLSGFLVTQLLLRDIAARRLDPVRPLLRRGGSGGCSRPRSSCSSSPRWCTRAIASPAEVADAVGSFKAAFLYSTNWYFIHQSTGYFGADITTNPVLHFWSLAVEEQFYLRLAVAARRACSRCTRRMDPARRMRVIRIAVAVGGAGVGGVGAVAAQLRTRTGPTTAPTPAPTSCSPAR